MQLFYCENLDNDLITLSEEEARHCAKVLRKTEGDTIFITDGAGTLAEATIITNTKTECTAQIINRKCDFGKRLVSFHLAVAPTKNHDRMEWLVEKGVEIGVEKISFIICEHSERKSVDLKRLQRIAISALKQSNTAFLPKMEQIDFKDFIAKDNEALKFIAYCSSETKIQLASTNFPQDKEVIVLIGPEGDFSEEEIKMAHQAQYEEVKLGDRRLRTETAALYACFCSAK
ncbi:MAG: 16S rRNA (uracil(1498)-N(3))-methyltransferase [Bacteroidales bacterium]|nr:16S rRNA (uracil(1498)-N(3))-methyltransferase [Bacteroidales bacterium]